MQLAMEQCIFIVKSYYGTKSSNQVQTKFRTLDPEHLPQKKTTIKKYVKKAWSNSVISNSVPWKLISALKEDPGWGPLP